MHDKDLIAAIETIEAEAFADIYKATPQEYAVSNGVMLQQFGSGTCLTHQTIVIPELARVVGLQDVNDFEVATRWMRYNCAPGWVVQIPPPLDELARYAEEQNMAPRGNGWAKFYQKLPSSGLRDNDQVHCDLTAKIVTAAEADAFANIISQSFGLPSDLAEWLSLVAGRRNWTIHLAYHDEKPVSCAAMYSNGKFGWFGIDGTLPHYRGRGGQKLLIRSRLEHAARLHLKGVTAETGQPERGKEADHASFSNYRKSGFTQMYVRANYALPAAAEPTVG